MKTHNKYQLTRCVRQKTWQEFNIKITNFCFGSTLNIQAYSKHLAVRPLSSTFMQRNSQSVTHPIFHLAIIKFAHCVIALVLARPVHAHPTRSIYFPFFPFAFHYLCIRNLSASFWRAISFPMCELEPGRYPRESYSFVLLYIMAHCIP